MTDLLPVVAATVDQRLVLADLLTDLRHTVDLLTEQVAAGDAVDSFLLAAAAVQIVEDEVQRDSWALHRGAHYAAARGVPAALRLGLAGAASGVELARGLRPRSRRAVRWAGRAAAVRDRLAARVLAEDGAVAGEDAAAGSLPDRLLPDTLFGGGGVEAELAAARALSADLSGLGPRLGAAIIRLPSCFRSFDQHPRDLAALAARYAERYPDRRAPVVVLGIRTSGSYLAPLLAAALRAAGYREVHVVTARPEFRLRRPVRELIRSATGRGGRVAVVDDPPATGSAMRAVAAAAGRAGTGEHAVSLVLPVFAGSLPERLRGYDAVLLEYPEWSVHTRLGPAAVHRELATLLGDNGISVRARVDLTPSDSRGHARTIVEAGLSDGRRRLIVAAGAGLGYLGRHALAVAEALPDTVPATYGFADGIVYRDWLPAAERLDAVRPAHVPELADYLRQRAAALPVAADPTAGLAGRQPVWEAASRVLQPGYGRLGVLLRPIVIDRLVRRLCAVDRPSVIDGATSVGHWFRTASGLRKVTADRRAFANTDLACYDPIFDLAGIDPGGADDELAAAIRGALPADHERFLLYELVHLWDRARDGAPTHRAAARAVQRYLAATVLDGVRRDQAGPLCALDLDGVLESDALGFPILTPTAATALRALLAHGYRPVPVTGRSLAEVIERCRHYGLTGGVAEYGAVAYDHRTGGIRELVSADGAAAVTEFRARLRELPGVRVDPDYRRIVRAYRIEAGQRWRLPSAVIRELLDELDPAGSRIRAVRGDRQTDFVPVAVDKGTGLAALTALLGGEPAGSTADTVAAPGIAFAIGDSAPDLAMFRLARYRVAPANADHAVRAAGITRTRHGYAAGLAEGVRGLLGHRPGGCPICAGPPPTPGARALRTLLDAQRAGASGLPGATWRGLRELCGGAR